MSDQSRRDAIGLGLIDREHEAWSELTALVRALIDDERAMPGYYRDPDWTVIDLVGHIGAWLAEGHLQLERIRGGSYRAAEVDIDAINAELLDALRGQSWSVVWTQANAARSKLLEAWRELLEPESNAGADASWWIAKAGPDHYAEHLPRLRAWVAELVEARSANA